MSFDSVYSQNKQTSEAYRDRHGQKLGQAQVETMEEGEGKSHGAPDIPGYIASAKTGEGAGDRPNQDRKQQPRRSVDIIEHNVNGLTRRSAQAPGLQSPARFSNVLSHTALPPVRHGMNLIFYLAAIIQPLKPIRRAVLN